jgi:hypothetical protein
VKQWNHSHQRAREIDLRVVDQSLRSRASLKRRNRNRKDTKPRRNRSRQHWRTWKPRWCLPALGVNCNRLQEDIQREGSRNWEFRWTKINQLRYPTRLRSLAWCQFVNQEHNRCCLVRKMKQNSLKAGKCPTECDQKARGPEDFQEIYFRPKTLDIVCSSESWSVSSTLK